MGSGCEPTLPQSVLEVPASVPRRACRVEGDNVGERADPRVRQFGQVAVDPCSNSRNITGRGDPWPPPNSGAERGRQLGPPFLENVDDALYTSGVGSRHRSRAARRRFARHADRRRRGTFGSRVEVFRASRGCASSGSTPTRPPSSVAASATVRAIGPSASRVNEIGMVPERLVRPSVGLSPTIPQREDGITIEPYVSRPMAPAAKFAATAAAEPELESPVLNLSAYGLRPIPARPLHPPCSGQPRKAFHSDMLALPSRIAPASRSVPTTPHLWGHSIRPGRATLRSSPSGRRSRSVLQHDRDAVQRSSDAARRSFTVEPAAIASASGFTSMIEFTRGPSQSIASIRARWSRVIDSAVASPTPSRPASPRSLRRATGSRPRAEAPAPWPRP